MGLLTLYYFQMWWLLRLTSLLRKEICMEKTNQRRRKKAIPNLTSSADWCGAVTLEAIADSWNSGTHRDKIVPLDYIRKILIVTGYAVATIARPLIAIARGTKRD